MKGIIIRVLGIGAAVAAIGCMDASKFGPPDSSGAATDSPAVKKAKAFKPDSPAGVAIDQVKGPPATQLWAQLITNHTFSARPDPFALLPKERNWEKIQTTNRVFGDTGQWRYDFQPQEEVVVVPVVEPQPYRRLAGVIVGDSVLALVDMGDGRLQLIRPGQDIDGWHVESISAEGPSGTAEAILTRKGNKLPHRVVVRLEEPPIGGANPGGRGRGGNNSGGGSGTGGGVGTG